MGRSLQNLSSQKRSSLIEKYRGAPLRGNETVKTLSSGAEQTVIFSGTFFYVLLFWEHGKRRNNPHAYHYIIMLKRLRYANGRTSLRASLIAVPMSDRVQCFPSILCLPAASGRISWSL